MISVIIPNYNSGDLLKKTFTSLINVSEFLSIEVIVVDNLSSDEPIKIIDEFPELKIDFLSEEDNGIYDAMNKGITRSKSKWLIFLGAGDTLIIPHKIPELDNENIDLIYGLVYDCQKQTIIEYERNLFSLLKNVICHQAIFYKKYVFNEFGLYSLRYPICADHHYNIKLFYSNKVRLKFCPILISEYLGNGISSNFKDIQFEKDKNLIILQLLIKNFNVSNLIYVVKYFKYLIFNN